MSDPTFVIVPVKRRLPWGRGDKGTFYVRLVAANGELLSRGELLTGDPHRHIEAVRRAAADAKVVDLR